MIESRRSDVAALDELSNELEPRPILEQASSSISWTFERFGDDVAVASSFQDVVLLDLVRKIKPEAEIIFLDTEFHFPETLAFVERLRKIWKLNLTVTHPSVGRDEYPCGSGGCCEMRKVEPLAAAIEGKAAWITGLKRVDTPERASAPLIGWDEGRNMVKVNPLAGWSDEDIEDYLDGHDLPRHPLTYVGYVSIGCAPTTKPVAEGQHPREGRWAGTGKTECGLHV